MFLTKKLKTLGISGTPGEIRTPDPLIRSQVLYPAEPRAHNMKHFIYQEFFEISSIINKRFMLDY